VKTPKPLLEVRALSKLFGGLRAVDLDLDIGLGELRCIIGPNGAGKSTLFKLLMGEIRPTTGSIRLRGMEICGLDIHRIARLGVSIKYQVPTVFEQLSLIENLVAAAEYRFGFEQGVARAWETLRRFGLEEQAAKPAAWLSHGARQWLEIGMATISDPQLVLLDEPTTGMTVDEMIRTVGLVHDLATRSTVIIVEHNLEFVRRLGSRITVMHRGKIFADGTMQEIESDARVRDIYLGKRSIHVEST
jgi:branched-chain amino acid transport system ATP-binding protein